MKVARRQSQQSDTSISSPGKSLGSKHSRTAEPGQSRKYQYEGASAAEG